MTATATPRARAAPKRGFALPSAYTILFILIVIVALLTWIIPAGAYDLDANGEPIPGTYHTVPANPQRIVVDSLMAPINGLYGIEGEDGSISVWNSGELFGAIDVALFILVIGGFLGRDHEDRRDPGRDRPDRRAARGPRTADDPDPDDRVRPRRHDVRDGRGEPRVLRADHHGHDRGRLRRAGRRRRSCCSAAGSASSARRSTRSRPASPRASPASRSTRASSAASSSSSSGRPSGSSSCMRYADRGEGRSEPVAGRRPEGRERGAVPERRRTRPRPAPRLTGRQKVVLVLFFLAFAVMIYGVIPWEDLGIAAAHPVVVVPGDDRVVPALRDPHRGRRPDVASRASPRRSSMAPATCSAWR